MAQIVTYVRYGVRGTLEALTAKVAFPLPALIVLPAHSIIEFKFHTLWFLQVRMFGMGWILNVEFALFGVKDY